MPYAVEVTFLRFAERGYAKLRENVFKNEAMQIVQNRPAKFARCDPLHCRLIPRPPGQCKLVSADAQFKLVHFSATEPCQSTTVPKTSNARTLTFFTSFKDMVHVSTDCLAILHIRGIDPPGHTEFPAQEAFVVVALAHLVGGILVQRRSLAGDTRIALLAKFGPQLDRHGLADETRVPGRRPG